MKYRYYSSKIEDSIKNKLYTELAENLKSCNLDDYFQKKSARLDESDLTIIMESKGKTHGLLTVSIKKIQNKTYAYIETLFVSDKYKGGHIGVTLIKKGFQRLVKENNNFPDYFVMKTYHPSAYLLMRYFSVGEFGSAPLYPQILLKKKTVDVDNNFKKAIFSIANTLNPDNLFLFASGVIKHGGGNIDKKFWKTPPLSNNSDINNFFLKELRSNDRLLCVISCVKNSHRDIVKTKLGIDFTPI